MGFIRFEIPSCYYTLIAILDPYSFQTIDKFCNFHLLYNSALQAHCKRCKRCIESQLNFSSLAGYTLSI